MTERCAFGMGDAGACNLHKGHLGAHHVGTEQAQKREPPSAFACNAAAAIVAAECARAWPTATEPSDASFRRENHEGRAEYLCALAEAIQDEIDKRWSGEPR